MYQDMSEGRSEMWQEETVVGGRCGRILPADLMAAASASSSFYPLQEMNGVMDGSAMDRALVASRNHREAEKRRRERIKSHLDRLRHLLSCDPKIDKATLLAKAVEHVRDLKHQTSQITNLNHFPTETDEITVDLAGDLTTTTGHRRSILKASLCCDDRPRLLPELIETLKSLRLRTLRAEIATVGGRVRGVLVVVRDEEEEVEEEEEEVGVLRDALKAVVEPKQVVGGGERMKRRRVLERDNLDAVSAAAS